MVTSHRVGCSSFSCEGECLNPADTSELRARISALEAELAQAKRQCDGLNDYSTKLADKLSLCQHERDAARAQMSAMRAVVEAARKLHANVGDGDNGPPAHLNEDWYALDEALDRLEKGK